MKSCAPGLSLSSYVPSHGPLRATQLAAEESRAAMPAQLEPAAAGEMWEFGLPFLLPETSTSTRPIHPFHLDQAAEFREEFPAKQPLLHLLKPRASSEQASVRPLDPPQALGLARCRGLRAP